MSRFLLLAAICLAGCNDQSKQNLRVSAPPAAPASQPADTLVSFDYTAPKMGTVFHLVLYASSKAIADRAAAAAWARVDQLNATFSDYDPTTELSKLSHLTDDGPMNQPIVVSPDMFTLLTRSIEAAEQSSGDFDITVGPLVQLWRRSRQLEIVPTTRRVEEAKKSVGYKFIRLDPANRTVQLLGTRMRLDVGGIAKGYTSMAIRTLLKEQFGLTHVFCGAAGDVAVGDPPPGKTGWTIALDSLDAPPGAHAAYINLANYGVSTSGDTARFVIIDGVRYSHIIDPQTGLGLTTRISVNAIAPDDTIADWLAAAVCILGPEKGLDLIERTPGAAARITMIEPDGVRVWESKRLKEFLVSSPASSPKTQP